jgi:hypothetical protein
MSESLQGRSSKSDSPVIMLVKDKRKYGLEHSKWSENVYIQRVILSDKVI